MSGKQTRQMGFYFDQTRCTTCRTCVVACKDWHDVPSGPASWRRVSTTERGKFPGVFVAPLAAACYHCEIPLCSLVCPASAITKREEDGVVIVDREKCREAGRCGIISAKAMGTSYSFRKGESPCQIACPAHIHIPGYVALIGKGRFKEALSLIRQTMPLPVVCGRVCLAPCEKECRRRELDEPIAIESLKRAATDYAGEDPPAPLPRTRLEKVAIVGSGPAGLAAAYDLVRMGYGVTVFEALPVAGGMLATGIPPHRLPKDALNRDIDYLKAVGVAVMTGSPVGKGGLSLDDLARQGYGAVLLAIGAQQGQKLRIPGADLRGMLVATSFMRDVNLGKKVKVGNKVVVLGGGNVAVDCARSALRLGAAGVTMACLEQREVMPADDSEIKHAEEEGIVIHPGVTFTRIIGEGGEVAGVECLKVRSCEFDKDGRPHIDVIHGTEHVLPADTVIFAIGQRVAISDLDGAVQATARGTIAVDHETLATNQEGIFAAGDATSGPCSVIAAITDGQKASYYIDRYLQGLVLRARAAERPKASDIKVDIPADAQKQPRQEMPALPVAERAGSFREVNLGFRPETAIAEAKRCLNCAGHLCLDVCPYGAPQFSDEADAKMQKCDFCLDRLALHKEPVCVGACPVSALHSGALDELKAKYGETREAPGFVYSSDSKPSVVFKAKRPARRSPQDKA